MTWRILYLRGLICLAVLWPARGSGDELAAPSERTTSVVVGKVLEQAELLSVPGAVSSPSDPHLAQPPLYAVGPPNWANFLRADFVYLSRSNDDFLIPFTSGVSSFAPAELAYGFEPGVRLALSMQTKRHCRLEISWLGLFEWSAEEHANDLRPSIGPGRLTRDHFYQADLNDFEVNFVTVDKFYYWDFLVGFRVIDTRDDFQSLHALHVGQTVLSESINAHTSNTLTGVQVGANFTLTHHKLLFETSLRTGLFNNQAEQSGTLFSEPIPVDGVQEPVFSTDGNEVSFVGDVRVEFRYLLSPTTSLKCGYQGLFLSEILQVARQRGEPALPAWLNFHGMNAGIEIRY